MYMCNKKKEEEQEVDKECNHEQVHICKINSDTYLMVVKTKQKFKVLIFNFNTYLIMNIMHYLMP